MAFGRSTVGNRWCIHPMEGWDANPDGSPSEHTLQRWKKFGESGAKLIWGGEAAAVRRDGRANPRQTLGTSDNRFGLERLLQTTRQSHRDSGWDDRDLVVGLQLTHSGRFSVDGEGRRAPRLAYHHPYLDSHFGIDPHDPKLVWADGELPELIDAYVTAAQLAASVGYQFVDVKACHGYLLHEFLSARLRPGPYGGDLVGRSRLLREIIEAIRAACPQVDIGVRISLFDRPPYGPSGEPIVTDGDLPYQCGFGLDPTAPSTIDLTEPLALIEMLVDLGVVAVNVSAGSPYYCPHVQRPAAFPPSDGYPPPEDPLVGVARQLVATRQVKKRFPDLPLVGTAYSYLQDYVPHVAQAIIRAGWADSVGLGRMVLSYPELPADVLLGRTWQRKRVCRTFSDCTTAPRHGLVSGCYPLDPYYKSLPEAKQLRQVKAVRRKERWISVTTRQRVITPWKRQR